MKHKTEDYKISAVKYYLKNDVSMDNVCEIFECSKTSLKRWIDRYKKEGSIKRHNRKLVSYKITEKQVKYALKLLKQNEQITIIELAKLMKKKYKKFNITPRQLGNVIRDNNKTRKRTRHEHFPTIRYKKSIDKKKDVIVCIGDFEQRKHRKFKEPIKGKGFRTLFRRSGYKTYLVDEFRTSCKCSHCETEKGDCVQFRKCRNPKPKQNNSILRWGVLMCKTCSALWNRDENSARNIYKIAYNAINGKGRPSYLSRSTVSSSTTSVGKLQCQSTSVDATQS